MKKSFVTVLFLTLLWGITVQAAPEAPVFNINGGVYENAIEVSITGEGDIYYTTDGNIPTTSSVRYTEPIEISPVDIDPEGTTAPKGTTIRAAVIKDGETSYVSSNTYFVGSGIWEYLGEYPIVNIIGTYYDLWDSSNGIYTNWSYEHKVPGVFHYITTEGQTEVNRTVEMKVSGHGSRSEAKKSLRIYFKKTDPTQSKFLEYDLIPGADVEYYSKVTFRISDWNRTNLRDPLAQRIAANTRCDIAQSVPMALFLNGEYWGLYECREQYDKDYLESHYGIDSDNIVFLDRDWTMPIDYTTYNGVTYIDKLEYSEGPEDGNEEGLLGETYYRTQWAYVKSLVLDNDFASDEVYEEFCSVVDVDNLIDYMIIYIYSGNDDWPGNNMKFWRVTEESIDPDVYGADGKWRFMVHDFDISYEDVNHSTLYSSTILENSDDTARHPKFATDLFEGLFKNADFRNEFAQRSMVYLRTFMSGASIEETLDALVAEREDGKAADIKRWNLGSVDNWKNNVNGLKNYVYGRPTPLRNQYMDLFNTYYNAGITDVILFNAAGEDCVISGGKVSDGDELKMFSGIPVTIEAENSYITVMENGREITAFGELTFTPSGDCQITVEKPDATIINAEIKNEWLSAEIEVGAGVRDNARLYAAGYTEDGIVLFVNELDIDNPKAFMIGAHHYKLFLWDGLIPLCEFYIVCPEDSDNIEDDPCNDDFDKELEDFR